MADRPTIPTPRPVWRIGPLQAIPPAFRPPLSNSYPTRSHCDLLQELEKYAPKLRRARKYIQRSFNSKRSEQIQSGSRRPMSKKDKLTSVLEHAVELARQDCLDAWRSTAANRNDATADADLTTTPLSIPERRRRLSVSSEESQDLKPHKRKNTHGRVPKDSVRKTDTSHSTPIAVEVDSGAYQLPVTVTSKMDETKWGCDRAIFTVDHTIKENVSLKTGANLQLTQLRKDFQIGIRSLLSTYQDGATQLIKGNNNSIGGGDLAFQSCGHGSSQHGLGTASRPSTFNTVILTADACASGSSAQTIETDKGDVASQLGHHLSSPSKVSERTIRDLVNALECANPGPVSDALRCVISYLQAPRTRSTHAAQVLANANFPASPSIAQPQRSTVVMPQQTQRGHRYSLPQQSRGSASRAGFGQASPLGRRVSTPDSHLQPGGGIGSVGSSRVRKKSTTPLERLLFPEGE